MELEPTRIQPKGAVEQAFYWLAALLMIAITATMLYSVVMRYFFARPPIWSEDVPRVLFIWMTFLTIGLAIRFGLNIRVTFLVDRMPDGLRRWVEVAMHLIVLATIGVLFFYSFPKIELDLGGTMLSTGWNNAVLSIPMPIGCVIIFVYQCRQLMKSWRGERY